MNNKIEPEEALDIYFMVQIAVWKLKYSQKLCNNKDEYISVTIL